MVRLQLYIHNEYNRDIIAADVRQHQQPLQPDRAHGLRAVPEPGRVLALARAGGRGGAGQLGAGFNSSKYTQLLAVIEEIGKDIRPTYAGNKSSAERLKRGIVHARILVREALMEAERSARQ